MNTRPYSIVAGYQFYVFSDIYTQVVMTSSRAKLVTSNNWMQGNSECGSLNLLGFRHGQVALCRTAHVTRYAVVLLLLRRATRRLLKRNLCLARLISS